MMIGAVLSQTTDNLSLKTLEEIWVSDHAQSEILSTIQPILSKILLRKDQVLFLDSMKFIALLVSEVYEKVEKEVLCSFTERFLAAAHFTANKYYHSHTFDQKRYLDCVSAILSVWTDCTTQQDLVIPKFTVYTRDFKLHILDAVLQCLQMKSEIKEKLLDQISSLGDIELFVKYTIVGRDFPKHHLHSLSAQPPEDTFRFWLLKHNITSIRSVSEFLSCSKADEDLLSAMCQPFYTLPSISSDNNDVSEEVQPDVNPDTLFFIDRGVGSKVKEKKKSPEKEAMSVENSPPVLAPPEEMIEVAETLNQAETTLKSSDSQDTLTAVTDAAVPTVEVPGLAESCIKIRNQRKPRNKRSTPSSDVIVVKCPKTHSTPKESSPLSELTEEKLASLPDRSSTVRSSRRRNNSEASVTSVGSAASVDSVASRTRNRTRRAAPETLAAITEQEEVLKEKAASGRKLRTPAVRGTPIAKQSTASKRGLSRKVSETIDETPQIPVRKTRSRKLDV
ncbi:hypothetical protein ACHWQZ_G012472 [Mnemiopsis leidyi]